MLGGTFFSTTIFLKCERDLKLAGFGTKQYNTSYFYKLVVATDFLSPGLHHKKCVVRKSVNQLVI